MLRGDESEVKQERCSFYVYGFVKVKERREKKIRKRNMCTEFLTVSDGRRPTPPAFTSE